MHARERWDDMWTVQHLMWWSTGVEWDALPETFHLVPQHLYLS